MPTVVLIGTLDSKGAEYGFVRERLHAAGILAIGTVTTVEEALDPSAGGEDAGGTRNRIGVKHGTGEDGEGGVRHGARYRPPFPVATGEYFVVRRRIPGAPLPQPLAERTPRILIDLPRCDGRIHPPTEAHAVLDTYGGVRGG